MGNAKSILFSRKNLKKEKEENEAKEVKEVKKAEGREEVTSNLLQCTVRLIIM